MNCQCPVHASVAHHCTLNTYHMRRPVLVHSDPSLCAFRPHHRSYSPKVEFQNEQNHRQYETPLPCLGQVCDRSLASLVNIKVSYVFTRIDRCKRYSNIARRLHHTQHSLCIVSVLVMYCLARRSFSSTAGSFWFCMAALASVTFSRLTMVSIPLPVLARQGLFGRETYNLRYYARERA